MTTIKTTFNRIQLFLMVTVLFFLPEFASAQETEMADVMRENGKIYVVVAVLVVIFIGLFIYMFLTDRKLSKLEEEIKK